MDGGFSTSSSNSGSTTPAPEKTEEETKPSEEKINEDLANKHDDAEVKYPANSGVGSLTTFKNTVPNKVSLKTVASVSKFAEEAKIAANIEYDYVTGKFFYSDRFATGESAWSRKDGYTEINGKYYKLQNVNDIVSASLVYLVNKDKTWDDDGNDGTPEVSIYNFDVVLRDADKLPVAPARFADAFNSEVYGFINTDAEVTPEEATVEGALNPEKWYKDENGLYHKIVSEKTAYHVGADWNIEKFDEGTPMWEYKKLNGKDIFIREQGNSSESCFVIKEKGYLRHASDEQLEALGSNKEFYNAFKVADTWGPTVSGADKVGTGAVHINGTAPMTKKEAMVEGGLIENKIDGLDVGEINNEYYNIKPADGYLLRIVGGELTAYRFTDDYKYTCKLNTSDYKKLADGRYVEIKAYDFTEKEISEAVYCKSGYACYLGKFYKVIAKNEKDNDNWTPSTFRYDTSWYVAGPLCVYDYTKELDQKEACDQIANAIANENSIVFDLDNNPWVLRPTVSDLKTIFPEWDDFEIVQLSTNGRFYKVKAK